MAESYRAEGGVGVVADRAGLHRSLLQRWRRQVRDGTLVADRFGASSFVPVAIHDSEAVATPALATAVAGPLHGSVRRLVEIDINLSMESPGYAPERSGRRPCARPGRPRAQICGTSRSNSSSQTRALPSEGARQSPRGESEPPAATLGPLGRAERLNWAKPKKRRKNTRSQPRISASV